jgi:hypothetical protein
VLLVCGAVSRSLLSGATLAALLIATLPLLTFAVLYELENATDSGHAPAGLIAMVLLLPFFQLVLGTRTLHLVWQACSLVVVLFYISAMGPAQRRATVRPVLPLMVAFEVLSLTGTISLFIAGALDARAILTAVVFALSGTYLLVGSVLRTWAGSAERASRVLVYGGLLQLPVVAAQAIGLTVGLGGSLSGLSSLKWGGVIASSSLVRYPGSFGNVELFAEWLGILLILAVGGAMYTRGRTRNALAICTTVFPLHGDSDSDTRVPRCCARRRCGRSRCVVVALRLWLRGPTRHSRSGSRRDPRGA